METMIETYRRRNSIIGMWHRNCQPSNLSSVTSATYELLLSVQTMWWCTVSTSSVWRVFSLSMGKNILRLCPSHLLPAGITGARHEWQKHWRTESRTNVINMTLTRFRIHYLTENSSEFPSWRNAKNTTRVGSRKWREKRRLRRKELKKMFSSI